MRTPDFSPDYERALKEAKSRRLKEIILDRAVQDKNLALKMLVELEQLAFPEDT